MGELADGADRPGDLRHVLVRTQGDLSCTGVSVRIRVDAGPGTSAARLSAPRASSKARRPRLARSVSKGDTGSSWI